MDFGKAITVIVAVAFAAMLGSAFFTLAQEQDRTTAVIEIGDGLCVCVEHEDGSSECLKNGQKLILDPSKDGNVTFRVTSNVPSGLFVYGAFKENGEYVTKYTQVFETVVSEHTFEMTLLKGTVSGDLQFRSIPAPSIEGTRYDVVATFHIADTVSVHKGDVVYEDGQTYRFSRDTTLDITTVGSDQGTIKWDAYFTDDTGMKTGGNGQEYGNYTQMWISWMAYFGDMTGDVHVTFEPGSD